MKIKHASLFVLLIISFSLFGQQIKKTAGFYIDENGEKYSGIYVSYFNDGTKEAVYTIKNGKENGSVEFYYPTNEIMGQGYFKDGEKNGKWVRWSVNGNKLAEANYNKGKKDGKWLIWDERGVKRYEMYYTNGEKTGVWLMWDEKGQISNKKEFH